MTEPTPADWYGALPQDVLDEVLTKKPIWYHVTNRENVAAILADGLRPGMASRWDGNSLAPRPGCTYMLETTDAGWGWEWTGLDEETGTMLAVNLTGIHPGRIFPDEDEWSELVAPYGNDPHTIGLPRSGEGDWPSSGAWAEAVRLGEQPGVSEQALRGGRIAVRGPIEPARIMVVELADPDEYMFEWENRHRDELLRRRAAG